MEIKTKGVSFNISDPHQHRLYMHCLQYTNFSSYVKSLIQRDMEGGYVPPVKNESNLKATKDILKGVI